MVRDAAVGLVRVPFRVRGLVPPGVDPASLDATGRLIAGDQVFRQEVEVMIRLPTLALPAEVDLVRGDGKHLGRLVVE